MTVVFDHRGPGTPEAAWLTCDRLAACPSLGVPEGRAKLVVLAAHPDDETLGAGGLIAAAGRSGGRVDVVIASDGEASHPGSPTHPPSALAAIRRSEAASALCALSPSATITFLGLPDGGLAAHRSAIDDALRARLDTSTVLVSPWSGDRHPDHEVCGLAARDAAARAGCAHWQYPIWAWHWADPGSAQLPWTDLRRLDLDAAASDAKRSALAAYASQHAPLSALPGDEAILPPHLTAHFMRAFETFVVTPSAPPAPTARDRVASASDSDYFDTLYSHSDDPWGLQDRWYEQRKRELVLAVLPRARFRRALEPGCASGLLTARLAQRCDDVLACDVADRAVAMARDRLAGTPNVCVEQRRIPQEWPGGLFDLIVLSEIGYYCTDLSALSTRVRTALAPDGAVVACHWRHDAPDHPHAAAEVHRALGEGLGNIASHVEPDFLLDVWTRSGESVARADGILT